MHFSLRVEEVGAVTLLRVAYGADAVRDLALADQDKGVDIEARWARSDAEAPNPLGVNFPEYPNGGTA